MNIFKKGRQGKSGSSVCLGTVGIFLLIFFAVLPAGMAAAEGDVAEKEDVSRGTIVNRYGTVMGSVDARGNIVNISGALLGTVDSEGNIFNVSKINIGKVTADGRIVNQSETFMGSVNNMGEIFNVSGRKLGEVKYENNLNRIGGAARLVILK